MIPAAGYGASIYWRNQMKDIANESGEACPCWIVDEPLIKFNGSTEFTISIECQDRKDNCQKTFSQTEVQLLNQFMAFYKG